jgi:hypothetical protein
LPNIEKDHAEAILSATGLSASSLGLRFDKVVVRVLGRLRSFAEAEGAADVTILVDITAPIRSPAKTVEDLKALIVDRRGADDGCIRADAVIQGNRVSLRLVDGAPAGAPKLIGFVHNPDAPAKRLLDLAEAWLRRQV